MKTPDLSNYAFIDGIAQPVEQGDTVLRFVDRHLGRGHVPTLCDAPQLEPYGACRVCSVEVALKADIERERPCRRSRRIRPCRDVREIGPLLADAPHQPRSQPWRRQSRLMPERRIASYQYQSSMVEADW